MVKNLRESASTLSLRPHPEIAEARQRVSELESQVKRLESMQRREMESLFGSAPTRNNMKDDVKGDQSARQVQEDTESVPSSSRTTFSHPSLTDQAKPVKFAEWPGEHVKDSESASYLTPSAEDNLRPRLPILLRHESLHRSQKAAWARFHNGSEAERYLGSQPSAMPIPYLEADKPAEQNTETARWSVPSFGRMEKYMPTEVGMGLDGHLTHSEKEVERFGVDAFKPDIPQFVHDLPRAVRVTEEDRLKAAEELVRRGLTRAATLNQRSTEYQRADGRNVFRNYPSPFSQHQIATSNVRQPAERLPAVTPQPNPYKLSSWDGEQTQARNPPIQTSLFEKFNQRLQEQRQVSKESLITKALAVDGNTLKAPEAYTQPFCDFLTENPTVFHAVDYFEKKLDKAGFKKLSERKTWNEELKQGGKYYVQRNGSSLIAFTVGGGYKSGNGVAMIAGHVDALTARLKPVSSKKTSAGYVQLGVAPYAGGLNTTWWDRDLGIGGRVLVKDPSTGKITTRLVKLGWPIARIPTLAPHFGVGMLGQNNAETQAVPIIGLDDSNTGAAEERFKNLTLGEQGTFAATQPPKLVRAIAGELSIQEYSSIVNWELELYDTQPAQTGGIEKEFIFGGRIDDKLCSWAAMEGLLASAAEPTSDSDGIIKLVGVFDDEEIGSLLRQGARGNFLPSVIERISESFSKTGSSANILSQTYANSFLVSADVTHAVNPNFLSSYLENHAPRLNVGLVVCADSNGHMTTDSVSTALLTRVAEKCGSELQLFMIRNDSRSGGTVGPMLSAAMGVRAIDAGIPQLSMHSIRATTGALDPGLGVKIFKGFLDGFEEIDAEFE